MKNAIEPYRNNSQRETKCNKLTSTRGEKLIRGWKNEKEFSNLIHHRWRLWAEPSNTHRQICRLVNTERRRHSLERLRRTSNTRSLETTTEISTIKSWDSRQNNEGTLRWCRVVNCDINYSLSTIKREHWRLSEDFCSADDDSCIVVWMGNTERVVNLNSFSVSLPANKSRLRVGPTNWEVRPRLQNYWTSLIARTNAFWLCNGDGLSYHPYHW